MEKAGTYTAFLGNSLVESGSVEDVLTAVKPHFDKDIGAPILIFEDQSGRQIDFDLRGSVGELLSRRKQPRSRSGRGRPKLGVIAREITLLPRHWQWLGQQPNGASAALRRLIDEARRKNPGEQEARRAIDAAARFLSSMAGNLPGYEEATRALYRRQNKRFDALTRNWPADIRRHARRLIRGVLH